MKIKLFFTLILPWALLCCGAPEPLQGARTMSSDTTTTPVPKPQISVTSPQSITPKFMDNDGKLVGANTLTVEFGVKITPAQGTPLDYNPKDWGLWIGTGTSAEEFSPLTTPPAVASSPSIPNGSLTSEVSGTVTITVDLTNTPLPQKVVESAQPDSLDPSRKLITVTPFYRVGGDKENTVGLVALKTKVDVGAIKTPVPIVSALAIEGILSMGFGDPEAWEAQYYSKTEQKVVSTPEPSSLGGYLVVYWAHDECASAQQWAFSANHHLYPSGTPVPEEQCAYIKPQPGLNPCSLGCLNPDVQASATPSIPGSLVSADFAKENEKKENKNCYTLVRFPAGAQKSITIKNIDPKKWYGAMVYPIDSSGKVGSQPSQCFFGKPSSVRLASTDINPNLPRSADCFVATAASGSPQSLAVHYWRAIRDAWLTPWGITPLYYTYAPRWAQKLEEHPRLKPATNWILEKTGWLWLKTAHVLETSLGWLGSLWAPRAEANDFSTLGFTGPSTFQLGGGAFLPTTHKKEAEAYYKPYKSFRLFGSYQWGMDIPLGELSLGPMLQYSQGNGKSFRDDDPKKEQSYAISYYSLGMYLMADYRLVWTPHPWLTPRISLGGGMERFRESLDISALPQDQDTTDLPIGVTVFRPSFVAKLALETSFFSWGDWARPVGANVFGIKDFSLQLFGQYTQEFGKKSFQLSGLTTGVGFSMVGY